MSGSLRMAILMGFFNFVIKLWVIWKVLLSYLLVKVKLKEAIFQYFTATELLSVDLKTSHKLYDLKKEDDLFF